MTTLDRLDGTVQAAVDQVASGLVAVSHWPDCSFINLPMSYPDGSDVTVKITRIAGGFRVSDNEFAFREAETYGLDRIAFAKMADAWLGEGDVGRLRQAVFLDACGDTLHNAVCEVAAASWRLAHQAIRPPEEDEIDEPEGEALADRLVSIFGRSSVSVRLRIAGASANPWLLTAAVSRNGHVAAFQRVSGTQYSIFRTSSAFSDLADLPKPPKLIAVVSNKAALGTKLGLLSKSGYVIEGGQPDDSFIRLAA